MWRYSERKLTSKVGDSPSPQPSPLKGEGAGCSASNSPSRSPAFLCLMACQLPVVFLICLLSGCQTTTVSTGPQPIVKSAGQQPAFTGDILDSHDPCGNRMQHLCGPLT